MSDYILSCCSTADMSKEYFESRNIRYACFNYELDGTTYKDDLGVTIPLPDFYAAMAEGKMTRTSQINTEDYEAYFEELLQENKPILHIAFSSGLSGSVNSAIIAADNVMERHPGSRVVVIDSVAASSGFGLLVDKAADLRDEGKTIEENAAWIEAHKKNLNHWFFTTTLTYFIRGGRVSKVSGTLGNMLNICPLLIVNDEGKLINVEKIRTKKKVKATIVDRMIENADNGLDYDGKCFISNSNCPEDAQDVARMIEEKFPKLNGKVQIYDIGTVIGSHTGPGTVAVFFWGKERTNA